METCMGNSRTFGAKYTFCTHTIRYAIKFYSSMVYHRFVHENIIIFIIIKVLSSFQK